jgi:hypothetical protein
MLLVQGSSQVRRGAGYRSRTESRHRRNLRLAVPVGQDGLIRARCAYPLWSICIFGVDMLIIYGLAAYGGRRREAAAAG